MRDLSRGISSSGRSGRSGAPTTSRAPRAVSTKGLRRRSRVGAQGPERGARDAGAADLRVGQGEQTLRRQAAAAAWKLAVQAAEDGGGRLVGKLLIDDRLGEGSEHAAGGLELHGEWPGCVDD